MAGQKTGKSGQKRTGIAIAVAAIVCIVGLAAYTLLSDITRHSSPGIVGNTAGNLYNYGLFCEYGDRIFFSNYKDQGLLYSMSPELGDFKLVTNDVARYINCDEHYIYYSRMNNLKDIAARPVFNFYSNGVFRIMPNGSHMKMLWNNPIGSLLYYDGQLYYQYYAENEKLSIHRMDIDGGKDTKLSLDESVAVCAAGQNIYYAGVTNDRSLYSVTTSGTKGSVVLEGSFYEPVVQNGQVTYIDVSDGYSLKRTGLDGTGEEVLVNERCSAFNMSGDGVYVYYQRDDGSAEAGLYMLNTVRGETVQVLPGNYKWINTAGDYCFFYDFDAENVYCCRIGGTSAVRFDPPVLSKK